MPARLSGAARRAGYRRHPHPLQRRCSGRIAGSQILQPSGLTRENRLMNRAAAEALSQCPVQVGTDEKAAPSATTTHVEYVWTLN